MFKHHNLAHRPKQYADTLQAGQLILHVCLLLQIWCVEPGQQAVHSQHKCQNAQVCCTGPFDKRTILAHTACNATPHNSDSKDAYYHTFCINMMRLRAKNLNFHTSLSGLQRSGRERTTTV